jgi:hypothetical protein
MQFNQAKLEKLNLDVQLGYRNLHALSSAVTETSLEITRTETEIARDPITLEIANRKRRNRPVPEFEDHLVANLRALERRLDKLKAKRAQLLSAYNAASEAQRARARCLENSVKFLRERGVEVTLVSAADLGSEVISIPNAGPPREFGAPPNSGALPGSGAIPDSNVSDATLRSRHIVMGAKSRGFR